MKQYIHAIPNFSEGARQDVINYIVEPFKVTSGVKLIDIYPDADFNRTVIEAIGEPEPLYGVLMEMTKRSMESIDMNVQKGSHPRIGAQDTIPIFPLKNITLEECKQYIERLGSEIYDTLRLPVFFSAENARCAERRSLDFIRKGQYEGLKEVVHTEERKPDLGEGRLHPTAGAVICSAGTSPLVAYNVILGSNDLELAKKIARAMRGPSGGFSTVRAVGFRLLDRNQVCVSMNLFDYVNTPIYRLFELVKREAERYGVAVVGSQLVGTLDQEALIATAEYYLQLDGFERKQIIENHLADTEDEVR